MSTPFNSHNIIKTTIHDTDLHSYLVGFDVDSTTGEQIYRWEPFIQTILSVIPEFSFGFHEGTATDNTNLINKVIEAAKAIYKIDDFQKVKDIYENEGGIDDDVEDKFLRRGEFGEVILHMLLREFHETIPLLSKIYFKDSYGHTVHGFDAIHIQEDTGTLWLGESKLYTDGKNGIKALIQDIKEHIQNDYMDSEFMLVSKKIQHSNHTADLSYWLDLMHKSKKLSEKLTAINIPLLCTYSSENFNIYDDENNSEFISEYMREINDLKQHFDDKNDHPLKTRLNIILLLFPVKDKTELVKKLHHKLSLMQALGD